MNSINNTVAAEPPSNRFEGFTPEDTELYVNNLTQLAGALDASGGAGLRVLARYDGLLLILARNGVRLNASFIH